MYKNIVSFANKYAKYIIAMLHYFPTSKKNLFWPLSLREPRTKFEFEQLCSPNEFILSIMLEVRTHRGGKNQILILLTPISLDSFHFKRQQKLGYSESQLHQKLEFLNSLQ